METETGERAFPWWLLLTALLVCVLPVQPSPGSNVTTRMALAFSIVDKGTLTIDDYADTTHDRSLYQGHWYSDKAPGSSYLAVPVYAALKSIDRLTGSGWSREAYTYWITVLVLGPISGLAAAALYRFARRRCGNEAAARTALAAFLLATPALIYTNLYFSHQMAAAFLFLSFERLARDEDGGVRPALIAASWAGLATLCEYPAALGAGWLFLYHFYRQRRWETAALFALVAVAAPLILHGLYNNACFDSPLSFGYRNLSDTHYQGAMGQGIMGVTYPKWGALYTITASPFRGLFFVSPVLAVGLVGIGLMLRDPETRIDAILLAAVVTTFVLFNAAYFEPDGASSFGPRHIAPMIPFLAVPVAWVARRGGAWRAAVWATSSVGAFVTVTALMTEPLPNKVIHNPFYELQWPMLRGLDLVPLSIASVAGSGTATVVVLFALTAVAFALAWHGAPAVGGAGGRGFGAGLAVSAAVLAALYLGVYPRAEGTEPGLLAQATGYMHATRGQHERAVADYRRATETREDPYLYKDLGRSYWAMGDWPEALAAYEHALALNPEMDGAAAVARRVELLRRRGIGAP